MAKFAEAINRMFGRVFVCRNCKTKIKTDMQKVIAGEARCKKCGGKTFRPIKRSR